METPTPIPAEKPKRKKRVAVARGPRVIDPAIKAIRDEYNRQVAEHRKAESSAKLLATITGKLLQRLTAEDRGRLANAMGTCLPVPEAGVFNGSAAPEPINCTQP